VSADDGPAALQRILAELAELDVRLYDAGMRRPTLDEVFLRLTGHVASEDQEETTEHRQAKEKVS
jgi:ABC-2 type transport system ATP-binding protein